MKKKSLLQLFILGQTPIARRAIKNLQSLCKEPKMKALYQIEIIDLYHAPECAEQEKILATPLLILKNSPIQCRIIGDLSNSERVLSALNMGCKCE